MPTPELAELMPNPAATGEHHLVAPNAAVEGYTLGADARADEMIAEIREWAVDRKNNHAEKALAALAGTDPILYPIASQVRPRVAAAWKDYETKLAALRASPDRRYVTREGIEVQERALATARDAQLDAAGQALLGELDGSVKLLYAKRDGLLRFEVTREDTHAALDLRHKLDKMTPQHGVAELASWLNGASAEAVAEALPLLRSLYDQAGTYRSNGSLLELIRLAEQTLDGGWERSVVDARLERAARVREELHTFLYLAKQGSATLNAVDADTQEFALFPNRLPPDGPAPEDRKPGLDLNPKPFKRITVSAAQRQRDELLRGAQEE